MLFDPDDGKTWEQLSETVWQRLPPAKQAEIQALAAASGHTRDDIMWEAVNEKVERLEQDPQAQQRYDAQLDFEECPFGRDPLLRKAGEP